MPYLRMKCQTKLTSMKALQKSSELMGIGSRLILRMLELSHCLVMNWMLMWLKWKRMAVTLVLTCLHALLMLNVRTRLLLQQRISVVNILVINGKRWLQTSFFKTFLAAILLLGLIPVSSCDWIMNQKFLFYLALISKARFNNQILIQKARLDNCFTSKEALEFVRDMLGNYFVGTGKANKKGIPK